VPRTYSPYAPEYRRRIIELARSGPPIAQLAREFEASANAIRKWIKQAGLDEGLRSDGLTHFLIALAEGSNSCANSSIFRPDSGSSTIRRRYSGAYGG
jgi:transposase-like protein